MINLDNNATTPLDPEVLKVMYEKEFGNPSSIHALGRRSKQTYLQVRKQFLDFFQMEELLFTSGATEAINYAIYAAPSGTHVITSSLEHAAMREAIASLQGCTVTRLLEVTPEAILEAITPQTKMIALSAANNETGIRIDLEAIAEIAYYYHIDFVVDAVALLGKELFTVPRGVTALCISAHKIHGPMGVGALVFRNSFKPKPLIVGGPQQRGLRAGTENLPAIVGFGKALERIDGEEIEKVRAMRDTFERRLVEEEPSLIIHGREVDRVSNVSNIAFPMIDGETLLLKLDRAGLLVSHGSACSSGALELSAVLLNMGIPRELVRRSLRFSFSRMNQEEEIERALTILLRSISRVSVPTATPLGPITTATSS